MAAAAKAAALWCEHRAAAEAADANKQSKEAERHRGNARQTKRRFGGYGPQEWSVVGKVCGENARAQWMCDVAQSHSREGASRDRTQAAHHFSWRSDATYVPWNEHASGMSLADVSTTRNLSLCPQPGISL